MVQMVKIIGMGKIKANLRLANIKMGVAGRRGLLKAGLFLQRKSQKVVPWEFRILENSAGTKPIGEGWHTDVVVYYTASYAVYVHEITTNKHKPGRKAKFLEDPAREYRAEILKIIAKEAGKAGKISGGGSGGGDGPSSNRWANQYGSGIIGE